MVGDCNRLLAIVVGALLLVFHGLFILFFVVFVFVVFVFVFVVFVFVELIIFIDIWKTPELTVPGSMELL